jgi:ribosomal-protein-alanine N-acetyltransferase
MLSLRSYGPEDFESLYEIDHACYQPAVAYSRRELRSYIHFPGADCLVVEADGKIAGFIVTEHENILGYIVTIDVLEAHRRLGVAAMLLAEAERKLAVNGVREITLETATENAAAIAFWLKHGYRTRGVKKGYYPGGSDAYEMAKPLTVGS